MAIDIGRNPSQIPTTQQLADAAYSLYTLSLKNLMLKGGLRPVATNCGIANVRGSSNSYMISSSTHKMRGTQTEIYVVFPGWFVSATGDKLENGSGNASIRASVEYPAGVRTMVEFEFGDVDGCVASGSFLIGKVSVPIPDGATFFVLTDTICPTGVIFTDRRNATAGVEEGLTAGTTLLASASEGFATPAKGGANCARPLAILAYTNAKGFLHIGNSHGYGTGDTADATTLVGAMARATGAQFGYINLCIAGDTTERLLTNLRRRAIMASTCTHLISTPPDNDIGVGATADQVKQRALALGRIPAFSGLKRFIENHRPRTDASNVALTGWKVGEQAANCNLWYGDGMPTADGVNPAAIGATGVLRCGDVGHPWSGVINVAGYLANSLTDLVWKVPTQTTDWVHANNIGVLGLVASGAYSLALAD